MPKFSKESISKLSTCHIDLQAIFFEVIKKIDCAILVGFRNEEDQNRAYENGTSEKKWPDGNHNSFPSTAVDVAPFPIDYNNTQRFCWFAGFVMGTAEKLYEAGKITHKIRWGGMWNENSLEIGKEKLNDYAHFELI